MAFLRRFGLQNAFYCPKLLLVLSKTWGTWYLFNSEKNKKDPP